MRDQKDLFKTLIDLLDGIAEGFVGSVMRPLVKTHATVEQAMEQAFRRLIHTYKPSIPAWMLRTHVVAYVRLGLAIPTIIFLSWGQAVLPATLIVLVHLATFLESVLAEHDTEHGLSEIREESENGQGEEESFEVVSTGSPHSMTSWVPMHRARIGHSFASSMVDRGFAIICLISLLHHVPNTGSFHLAQYFTLVTLIGMESANGCLAFFKFFTTSLISPPNTEAMLFSHPSITPIQIGKIKLTLEYAGMTLLTLPFARYAGLLLCFIVVPMEYELLRERTKKRVFYTLVDINVPFDHKILKAWMQMKSLSSKLIVGVPGRNSMEMVLNVCASNVADGVVVEAPTKADLLFLAKQGIDYVVILPGQTNLVTDEVINANRVLLLGNSGFLGSVRAKSSQHKE